MRVHAGVSGGVNPKYAFDVVSNRNVFSFSDLFKKQILTKSLTVHSFLNITPNELIVFRTFLKFCLVYFKIYVKKIQTTFLYCFETMC